MKRVSNLLAWGAIAMIGALVVLNWSTLMISAPLDIVVTQVQVPLGAVMVGAVIVLFGLFIVATLHNRIKSLLELRRLLKEVQRLQELANKAEASRIEELRRLIAHEFQLLNKRLSSDAATAASGRARRDDGQEVARILAPTL